MPSLRVWGGFRFALIAGDDLRVLSQLAFVYRFVQAALLIPTACFIFAPPQESTNCQVSHQRLVWTFWSVSAATVVYSLCLEGIIFHVSSQGAPVEVSRRSSLSLLCSLNLFPMTIARCATVVLAIRVAVSGVCNDQCYECKDDANRKILLVLAGTHCLEFVAVAAFLIVVLYQKASPFQRCLRLLQRWNMCRRRQEKVPSQDFWHALCRGGCSCVRLICCGILGGSEVATMSASPNSSASCLSEISLVLAEYFDHGDNELDVTPSDLVAGLMAVAASQRLKRKGFNLDHPRNSGILASAASLATGDLEEGLTECAVDDSSFHITDCNDDDLVVISPCGTKRRRVLKVARLQLRRGDDDEAFYEGIERVQLLPENARDTHYMVQGVNFMRLSLAVYGHLLYIADNPCSGPCRMLPGLLRCQPRRCNEQAFFEISSLPHEQLLYYTIEEGIEKIPYAIVLDEKNKNIAVVLRGTLSLEDIVTDLDIRPVAFADFADRCPALATNKGFCHGGTLKSCLWVYEDLQRHKILDRILLEGGSKHAGYTLVCTGHSLGAGCAAVVATMLKTKFQSLLCYCFSPPGCVLSQDVATQTFISTFILDSDIVPRMSLHSIEALRNEVLQAISRIRVPKHKLRLSDDDALMYNKAQIPDSPFAMQLDALKQHREKKVSQRDQVQLVLPGARIIHLVKDSNDESERPLAQEMKRHCVYSPVWADASDFEEISIRKSLFVNHTPARVLAQFERVSESFGVTGPLEYSDFLDINL